MELAVDFAGGLPVKFARACERHIKNLFPGKKIHRHLNLDALDKVERQLLAVTNIASCSVAQKDFEASCLTEFLDSYFSEDGVSDDDLAMRFFNMLDIYAIRDSDWIASIGGNDCLKSEAIAELEGGVDFFAESVSATGLTAHQVGFLYRRRIIRTWEFIFIAFISYGTTNRAIF